MKHLSLITQFRRLIAEWWGKKWFSKKIKD